LGTGFFVKVDFCLFDWTDFLGIGCNLGTDWLERTKVIKAAPPKIYVQEGVWQGFYRRIEILNISFLLKRTH
jgi:hypothetical protein